MIETAAATVGDLIVNGVRVRVHTALPSLLPRLAGALATDLTLPAETPAVQYRVMAVGDGSWSVSQDGQTVFSGDEDALVGWLEWATINRVTEQLSAWWRIHAGAVVHGAGAVLLPADSRTGKSTLVAALVQAGLPFLSDELALLDEQGRVHPFVKAICLRAGAFPLMTPPITHPSASRHGEPVYYVDPRPRVASAPAGYPIKAIVHLTRGAATTPRAMALSKAEALMLLIRQTSASQQMGFGLVQRAVALVQAVPLRQFELGSDLAACVRTMCAMLESLPAASSANGASAG